ncbi:MAG: hypothetical protein Q9196_001173 [Gyalolechia fulgens]
MQRVHTKVNAYGTAYFNAADRIRLSIPPDMFFVLHRNDPSRAQRGTHNKPTSDEVAGLMIMPTADDLHRPLDRQVFAQKIQGNGLKAMPYRPDELPDLDRPEPDCPGKFNRLLHRGRLFQRFVVDAAICAELNDLNYHRQNKKQLGTDPYSGFMDRLDRGYELGDSGKPITVLPSTYNGGHRYMTARKRMPWCWFES